MKVVRIKSRSFDVGNYWNRKVSWIVGNECSSRLISRLKLNEIWIGVKYKVFRVENWFVCVLGKTWELGSNVFVWSRLCVAWVRSRLEFDWCWCCSSRKCFKPQLSFDLSIRNELGKNNWIFRFESLIFHQFERNCPISLRGNFLWWSEDVVFRVPEV